ncbi:hypothetical protein HDU96_003523, partial [Phlyctochytrium bullatum]
MTVATDASSANARVPACCNAQHPAVLSPTHPLLHGYPRPHSQPHRRRRSLLVILIAAVTCLWFTLWAAYSLSELRWRRAGSGKVPVTAFVMSKCPDAVFCEAHLEKVFEEVGHIVEFTTQVRASITVEMGRSNEANLVMKYIAKPSNSSKYGAVCLHGDTECQGNILQLCVRQTHPHPHQWFPFILCQNRDYRSIPSRTQSLACAAEANVDFSLVEECIASGQGRELFEASLGVTASAGATKSCTIFVDGKK